MSFGLALGFPRMQTPLAASLQLVFAGATSIDSRITFTRASTATYFNSSGVLSTAAANVPRFDYDPVTLLPKGLLIEESRANLLLQSRDMTTASWTKTDVTPTRNQVGLDGAANSACLITEGTLLTAITTQGGGAVTAGSTITGSFVVKRGNTDWVRLVVGETTATDGANAWFNLNTGAKGSVAARGAGTNNSSTITSLGGGWYRLTVTTLPNGTYTLPAISVLSAAADASISRVSGATYIVDYAQLEVGSFASSPIATTTTAVTRAADSASMTVTNFSSWYNQTAGTFFAECDQTVASGVAGQSGVFCCDDGTTNNRIGIRALSASGDSSALVVVAGSALLNSGSSVPVSSGVAKKLAMSYVAGAQSLSQNGAAVTTGAAASVPTVTQVILGAGNGNNYLNGHIRRIQYWNQRLPNATLQSLTA